jgi:hypothetical protein
MALTVVTLATYALATIEDVTQYMQLEGPPSAGEAELVKRVINAATDRVERHCGRHFVGRAVTEFYDGEGSKRLYLRMHPVVSVSQADYLAVDGSSYATYLSSDLLLDTRKGVLMLKGGYSWTHGIRNWQIQYTPGWATLGDVPSDVVLACMKLCAEYWRQYANRRDDIDSMSVDGQTVFYSRDPMPKDVKALLGHFVVPYGTGGE